MTTTAIVPIRSFGGLTRLSAVLDEDTRASLIRRLAARTVAAVHSAGARVLIVSNDAGVTSWSEIRGYRVVPESEGSGLNGAAAAGIADVGDGPWIVIHADLPALGADDVRAALRSLTDGHVLAPSHDGGTSLIGSTGGGFPFQYGPGSFRRHLSAIHGKATILIRSGLALDLDRPWDLNALRRLGHL